MDCNDNEENISIKSEDDSDSYSTDDSSDCSSEKSNNQNEFKIDDTYLFDYKLIPTNALINGNYTGIIPNELKNLTIFEKSSIVIYNPMTKIIMRGFDRYPYHKGKIYTIVNNLVEISEVIPKQINYFNTTIINSHKKKNNSNNNNEINLLKFKNKYVRPEKLLHAANILNKINYLYENKIKIGKELY